MPIVLEPTPYLNQRLELLPESQASLLWQELDRVNTRLHLLIKRIEARHRAEPERKRIERNALDVVARTWEMRPEHLISAERYAHRVAARGQLISVLHDQHGISFKTIGRLLHRDRSTVAHAYRQHQMRMEACRLGIAHNALNELDYATRYEQVIALCPPPSPN